MGADAIANVALGTLLLTLVTAGIVATLDKPWKRKVLLGLIPIGAVAVAVGLVTALSP